VATLDRKCADFTPRDLSLAIYAPFFVLDSPPIAFCWTGLSLEAEAIALIPFSLNQPYFLVFHLARLLDFRVRASLSFFL